MHASRADDSPDAARAVDRSLPWADDRRLTYQRLHQYWFATEFASGKRVLDVRSGDGAGSALLAQTAASVLALESDADAHERASRRYPLENVQFRHAQLQLLNDLPARSFDLIVCFDVMQHVGAPDGLLAPDALMAAAKGLLTPDGLLVLSTPDRDATAEAPWFENPFHTREFNEPELSALLAAWFSHHATWRQSFVIGSELRRTLAEPSLGVERIDICRNGDNWEPVDAPRVSYLVAIASASPLPTIANHSLLAHRDAGPVAPHDAPSPDAIAEHYELWEPERLYRQITIFETALAAQMTDSHTELTQIKATRAWRTVSRFWRLRLALRRWVRRRTG